MYDNWSCYRCASVAVNPVTYVCLQKLLQVHPPALSILYTSVFLWLAATGATSDAINPVFICLIIITVSGAPSGAVHPVTYVRLQGMLHVHTPVLLILYTSVFLW